MVRVGIVCLLVGIPCLAQADSTPPVPTRGDEAEIHIRGVSAHQAICFIAMALKLNVFVAGNDRHIDLDVSRGAANTVLGSAASAAGLSTAHFSNAWLVAPADRLRQIPAAPSRKPGPEVGLSFYRSKPYWDELYQIEGRLSVSVSKLRKSEVTEVFEVLAGEERRFPDLDTPLEEAACPPEAYIATGKPRPLVCVALSELELVGVALTDRSRFALLRKKSTARHFAVETVLVGDAFSASGERVVAIERDSVLLDNGKRILLASHH
jgi:hypothetical protein